MIASGVLLTLVGFENSKEDGTGASFNFILSNGTRSDRVYSGLKYTFMIPFDALTKIRSVTIHHNTIAIRGFSFFDKDGALLWKIGETDTGRSLSR